ncbi:MAG: sensor histidine kinase, partial [Terriglobales bacterium]
MWSVRNRLIVTYLFIGGVPVTLAVVLALGTGYIVIEHLATSLAVSEINAQQQRLGAANAAIAQRIAQGAKREQINTNAAFPGRTISVIPEAASPKWLKDGFTGLVFDQGQYYVRAVNTAGPAGSSVMVISSVPFDRQFVARVASGLGSLTFAPREVPVKTENGAPVPEINAPPTITAGSLPAPKNRMDREVLFGGLIETKDWTTGRSELRLLGGNTRLSIVYAYFTSTSSLESWTETVRVFLLAAAVTFATVVLVALIIGIRLTRTITYSVANLYSATERVNRGDFTHRIKVREKDQLAALQTAFNSMTESLQKLIVEQKEKERLQSELEIAHEVQAQLFPQAMSGTPSLELYGVCRP